VFKPNAEASEARGHAYDGAALAQYAAEFAHPRRGWFDGLVDGLNRLVRLVITFGLLGILPAVVIWPEGAAIAFAALALLPAGYWALVTVIIGSYFGGRMQLKAQDFQKSVQSAADRAPEVIANIKRLRTASPPMRPPTTTQSWPSSWRRALQKGKMPRLSHGKKRGDDHKPLFFIGSSPTSGIAQYVMTPRG
jgi:hypothetical protein